jgi:hypothetical protein
MKHLSIKSSTHFIRRVYRLLLYLYPSEFRRAYADELTLLFVDMHRAARAQGVGHTLRLWMTVLFDLISSASRERVRTMLTQRSADFISLLLCLPFLFLLTTAVIGYEPPFAAWFTEADGYTPTLQGRIVMIVLLLSVPTALLINLLPRLGKGNLPRGTPFIPTTTHILVGSTVLLMVLMLLSQQLFYELRPFVAPLGSASIVGQGLCLLGVLIFPMVFLLNRLPSPAQIKLGDALNPPAISIGLIVGATILLIVIGILTIFGLETLACASGVPKCD